MRRKQVKGITLIALVVTIIIMLILVGVTISVTIGGNGLFKYAKTASDETTKQTATEAINFKITKVQMAKYVEEQRKPTLKELADNFCEDDDFEYVQETTRVASLTKIANENPTSIYTKLKEYPYEFEINSSLQLASVDGVRIASVPENDGDSIVTMTKSELDSYIESAINSKLQEYSKTTDISSTYATKDEINNNEVVTTELQDIASGVTLTRNVIRKSGNTVYIDIRGSYNKEFKSGDLIIGVIPNGFRPTEEIVSTCNVSEYEYASQDSSYLYIGSNGNLQVRNNKTTDYRYFHICECYITE